LSVVGPVTPATSRLGPWFTI